MIASGGLTEFGENMAAERMAITCRDCYGFGHSMKKCPTARKLDLIRKTGDLIKITISRYR